jgi:hypothetical protein
VVKGLQRGTYRFFEKRIGRFSGVDEMRNRWNRIALFALCTALAIAIAGRQLDMVHAQSDPRQANENKLTVTNDSDLPDTSPGVQYEVHLQAQGGTSPYRWRLDRGALPPGIKLMEQVGFLTGMAEHAGEFQFTLSVNDNQGHSLHKSFVIRVRSALSLNWKDPARVDGNRIEGSVEVSNTTGDDIDLTFIVKAVATMDNRATAIGYQHFVLAKGGKVQILPFGDTLPRGNYIVHVDAVGEVASKKTIYRERMQTPGALQVTVGP